MFIKNENKYILHIVHNDITIKVVEGIADVSQEVRDHLVGFPEWSDVVEKISDKVLKALEKAKEEAEKILSLDKDDKIPPQE